MNSSKRSESDWQGLVSEVSAALLKHGWWWWWWLLPYGAASLPKPPKLKLLYKIKCAFKLLKTVW